MCLLCFVRDFKKHKAHLNKNIKYSRSTWMSQSVKYPILGFGSGHDLTVCGFERLLGLSAVGVEPA